MAAPHVLLIMKNPTDAGEQSALRKLSSAWSLISLGFLLGITWTCLFFREELQGASPLRGIQFNVVVLIILSIVSIPPLIFEAIRAIRTWQQIRRRNVEQVVDGKLPEPPEPVPMRIVIPPARFPEEPGAVVPHAGICEGGTGQPVSLPQSE